tara:strand:- start:1118 stop:2275 length:1158 start_codon:yes stop_codon:yes gene_type:complete
MKKQKVCIVGGGLTGLITAIALSKLNLEIDLVTGSNNQNLRSNRTIAISQSNFNFIKDLNIFKLTKKDFWPCVKMKLYTETESKSFSEIFYFENKEKNVLYILENKKVISLMNKKISKIKNISVKTNKKILKINSIGSLKSIQFNNYTSNYNLIIICTGHKSLLIKNIFKDKLLEHSYEEMSVTTTIKHEPSKNKVVRQIFLNNEILALLPISSTKTSIVWSVKKNLVKENISLIKKKLELYAKNYYKKVQFFTALEFKDLNFLVRKKYYNDRILLFGDALHVVHPLVGQGFNMILRDLSSLKKNLGSKIGLGLDIGSDNILEEFSNETKSNNLVYSLGIDFIKNSFSVKKKTFKSYRDFIIKSLNKNSFVKNIFFNLADKGIKF